MSPFLALLACYGFIFWLFRMDLKLRRLPSRALLIPFFWLTLISSRPLSFWLSLVGIQGGGTSNLEGNPIDLVVFLCLIFSAAYVLSKRGFSWGDTISRNKLLFILYAYFLVSASWSEQSFPALKRIIKDFGSVVVALVILTEKNPLEVTKVICVRIAYLLFPLSVVFMKYYPEIGRQTSRSGSTMFQGVAMHKSSLGAIIFLFGLFMILDILELRTRRNQPGVRMGIWIRVGMLLMGFWCMKTIGSATSFICFSIGAFLLWGTGRLLRLANPVQMLVRCSVFGVLLFVAEKSFDISGFVLEALGKNKTLTGRTEIWELVEQVHSSPILGSGYLSFWESSTARPIADTFAGYLNSAHNGFLDMYLEGGFVGVFLLILLLLGWGWRNTKRMLAGSLFGRMAFTVWVLGIVFNNSETAFFRLDPVWFMVLLMCIECLPPPQAAPVRPARLARKPALAAV